MARWKRIPGFPLYEASTAGEVRNRETGRVLKGFLRKGYYRVHLRDAEGADKWRDVHYLVCLTFRGPPPEPDWQASHGNGDRTDARLRNIRWKPPVDNMADKVRHGTAPRGHRNPQAKLTPRKARQLRKCEPEKLPKLAKRYGVSCCQARRIRNGEAWNHL